MTYGNFQCAYDERICEGEVRKVEKQRRRTVLVQKAAVDRAVGWCPEGLARWVFLGGVNLFCFILCFFLFSFVIFILCFVFYLLLGEDHKGRYGRTGK